MSILILHIVVALAGIVSSTAGLARPNPKLQTLTWSLIAATVSTGTVLTVQYPSHLVESCVMGLIYVGVTVSAALITRGKLAAQPVQIQK